jgi:hypothetical protein
MRSLALRLPLAWIMVAGATTLAYDMSRDWAPPRGIEGTATVGVGFIVGTALAFWDRAWRGPRVLLVLSALWGAMVLAWMIGA